MRKVSTLATITLVLMAGGSTSASKTHSLPSNTVKTDRTKSAKLKEM